jgi:hypothetical protein
MKIKLIGDYFSIAAASTSSLTFPLILSKSGLKNVIIIAAGRSTDEAPLYFKCIAGS